MLDEVFAPHLPRFRKMGQHVIGHLAHHAALVIAGKNRECFPRGSILLSFTRRDPDKKKGERFQQMFLGQDLAIEELHRIFFVVLGNGLIGQTGVVPTEVLFPARISGRHHVAGIGSKIQEGVLKNHMAVVARSKLSCCVMHVLVLFVLDFQRHDGQAV